MKILQTLTSYLPAIGGAQTHAHKVAVELRDRHRVQVVTHWDQNRSDWLLGVTLRAPEEARDYEVEGIPVHRLGLSRAEKLSMLPAVFGYYLAMRWAIREIARRVEAKLAPFGDGADLIHNGRIGREPLSYASLALARRLNRPFVLTPYHHPRWGGWLYRHYLRLYRLADGLIAMTEAEKRILVQVGVAPDRIHVTGIGPVVAAEANPEAFRARHGLQGSLVLFLGQHYRYKGVPQLLAAMPLVWESLPETEFAFIGPSVGGSERWFEPWRDRRVHRLGAVGLQEKTDALAACDLLCVPSTQESFGGVYLEAWTQTKPVIGCPVPAVSEVIDNGVDGLLTPQDPEAIAERILRLLQDPGEAGRLGRAGREKVEGRYTWGQVARRTDEAYRRILAAHATRA